MPRFRCLDCRKTFSEQTFRHDYRDRRPEVNARLFQMLISGVGLRQSGRILGLGVSSVQRKFRKLGRTCRALHDNLSRRLPEGREYLLDEEESYETLAIRPLTVPILIERETWFAVSARAAPIRRLARRGSHRRRQQDRDEALHGRRVDRGRECVQEVMLELARRTSRAFVLDTDLKGSYVTLAKQVFAGRARHRRTPGSDPRTPDNPLTPINVTITMLRDNCGRLRRKSWLVSKKCKFLEAQLAIFIVYRNYVRRRFNRDPEGVTSAVRLGLLERQLTAEDVVRWRQDWGPRSIHPVSRTGRQAVTM